MITHIWENDLEAIEKVIKRYQKLYEKHGGSVKFNILDTIYQELDIEGETNTYRFYVVEVEGCIKIDGWELIALTDDAGNDTNRVRLLTSANEDYPLMNMVSKFHHELLTCEHCNTNRHRKHTAWVRNTETGEFKQLGLECLKLYTGGLSAAQATMYSTLFDRVDELSDYEDRIRNYGGTYMPLFPIEDVVSCAQALIDLTGFKSRSSVQDGYNPVATADEILDVLAYRCGNATSEQLGYINKLKSQYADFANTLQDVNYKLDDTNDCIDHLRKRPEFSTDFETTLRRIFLTEYVSETDFGIIAAGVNTWNKYKLRLEKEKRQKELAENSTSTHIGNKGDKIEVEIGDAEYITCFDSRFGTSFLYKFHDVLGNEIIWWSSRKIEDIETWEGKIMKCTVKEHVERNGIKQTSVIRCKLK